MDKEQIIKGIEEINYLTDSITKTIEYLEGCLIEILKQKEQLDRELSKITNKRNKIGFITNQNKDE